jgi:hypothetical protein
MSGPNVSSGEMPGFPPFRRPAPELDDSLLDTLLSGDPLPPDAPGQARTMADMLASVADPASPGALAGETAARAAFVRANSPASLSPVSHPPARPGHAWLPTSLAARIAAAVIAATVGLGGAAAAAYGGVLPGPIQDLAHQAIGAPAAHTMRAQTPGHSDSRPAAARLCAAYQDSKRHGSPGALRAEFVKLAKAAGGPGKINSYCTAVQRSRAGHGSAAHGKAGHGKPGSRAKGKHRAEPKASGNPKAQANPKAAANPRTQADPAHPAGPA